MSVCVCVCVRVRVRVRVCVFVKYMCMSLHTIYTTYSRVNMYMHVRMSHI